MLVCEMAAHYKQAGKTLCDAINDIYRCYGYCKSTLHTYALEGAQGEAHMNRAMEALREARSTFGPLSVEEVLDFSKGIHGLPASNVLQFRLAGGSSLTVRPSGTEPKLKLYLSVRAASRHMAAQISEDLIRYFESIIRQDVKE